MDTKPAARKPEQPPPVNGDPVRRETASRHSGGEPAPPGRRDNARTEALSRHSGSKPVQPPSAQGDPTRRELASRHSGSEPAQPPPGHGDPVRPDASSLDSGSEPARSPSARSPSRPGNRLLRGTGLSLAYNGRTILDAVDIGVASGEVVTIVGLNGCGKSTLVRALLGLTRVDAGTIWHRPGLRIGYTPQRPKMDPTMPMTVARYLTLGGRHDRARLSRTLAEVELDGALDAQMAELSGGEYNRIALARALLRDPDILVLDEPLSSVDFAGQVRLYELIETIRERRGCGILMVSHDLHLVMSTTDIVVCLNHHVCCSGKPTQVLNHPEFVSLFGQRLAESLAVYTHRHDHAHDPSGRVIVERNHAHDH